MVEDDIYKYFIIKNINNNNAIDNKKIAINKDRFGNNFH
jgi:hypothetical protein